MNMFIIDNELAVRLAGFLAVFLVMALWEIIAPRRGLSVSKSSRWAANVMITILGALAVRLLFPVAAAGTALIAAHKGWGVLPALGLPEALSGLIAFLVLDLAIYLQHSFFHRNHLLWRLHLMHHTDLDIDVSTGARFHPLEIVISMLYKMALVAILGAPAWSVVLFEIVLNATSMFNHGNVRMPLALDRVLRTLLVTPDMHRVHHSVIVEERNSNYGFNFPWWDRLFGTYTAQPEKGHLEMAIGLHAYRDQARLSLIDLVTLPFRAARQ
jgi:sterol desaturase/sphingolipid hydroxylase (fatty acid hydroxylase superfamily)